MATPIRLHYSVQFAPCGAENHPAFSSATLDKETGLYTLHFPVQCTWLRRGRAAQAEWAQDKAKHLRSWGEASQGRVIER